MKLTIPRIIEQAIQKIATNPDEITLELYKDAPELHNLDAAKISGLVYMLAHAPEIAERQHVIGVASMMRLIIYALHIAGHSQYEIALLVLTIGARKNAEAMSLVMLHAVANSMEHDMQSKEAK